MIETADSENKVPQWGSETFDGSICIRQRIAASYRKPFFDLLAQACTGTVTVIAGQPDHDEAIGEIDELDRARLIKVENVYRGSGVFYRYYQPEVLNHVQALSPTMFVTEPNPRFTDMSKVCRAVSQMGIPVIGWGIGTTDFWNKPLKQLRKWYRARVLRHFDGMLCYSTKAERQYQELGYSAQQTCTLFNSTVSRSDSLPPARPDLQLPTKILSVGRLIESKGFDRLIRAAAMLQQNQQQIHVTLVGDGPHRGELEQLAKSLDAPVTFAGKKFGTELAEVSAAADLFVLPGLGGLAIQEAMARGLPVMVTEADGTELDLVTDRNGWIIEKENTQALADGLTRAVSDPDELRRRGRESFRIVNEEINLELMSARFISAANRFVALHKLSQQK